MILRAVIIDDEEAGVKTLKILASRNDDLVRTVCSALNPEEGIACIEDYKPDVVFLDINMPTMTGFELLAKLNFRGFKLVFTTAHKEYAIEAIKNKAFDYLLKPIGDMEFRKCLEDILAERKNVGASAKGGSLPLIEVQVKDGIVYIKQKEIIRLEAAGSYTEFYLDNGMRHIASKGLAEFGAKLDPAVFYRCHKSHIVNLYKVEKFINHDGFYALMSDGSMPDISKNNKEVFLERLKSI